MNWKDITYLKSGSEIQKQAFKCLNTLQIFDLLAAHSPILTGTIPIGISIDSSDLDIACNYMDADKFEKKIQSLFGEQKEFKIQQKEKNGYWVVIATFNFQNFPIELFGSLFPPTSQNSYRHMLIEHRILQLLGEDFKQQIIHLKQNGLKTEPAFAKLFQLDGDPFQQLLEMDDLTDTEILQQWNRS
ncbi:hypothetical protein BZG02_01275 [Labilibaculum filiforme]|uniref:Diadenosine tetraphosphate hydrolase n=1 Tax=Labilibaculum filiforme TaxID=1940526 RepID=A0A2N3I5T4_9BACT|nr:DUF4269 domain-containing protein [Labilibaculum filiforme]PKQ65665.1 hypothetical protein BZG02_01275 [Labilibaculum filiforme]